MSILLLFPVLLPLLFAVLSSVFLRCVCAATIWLL